MRIRAAHALPATCSFDRPEPSLRPGHVSKAIQVECQPVSLLAQ